MRSPTPMPVPVGDEPSITVEQGPEWLADLLFNTPGWLSSLAGVTVLVVGVWIVYQIGERDLNRETKLAMVQHTLTLVCCAGATWLLVRYAPFGYLVDVGVGTAIGFVLAVTGRHVATPVVTDGTS